MAGRYLIRAAIGAVALSFSIMPDRSSAETTAIGVKTALEHLFGFGQSDRKVLVVSDGSDGTSVKFDRDAFVESSHLPFLARYLPESLTLRVTQQGGFQFQTVDPRGPFTAETRLRNQTGVTSAGYLDIRGVIPFGLLGQAVLNSKLKNVRYLSADAARETVAKEIGLNVYPRRFRSACIYSPLRCPGCVLDIRRLR